MGSDQADGQGPWASCFSKVTVISQLVCFVAVSELLETELTVVVYNGQLDLIVDTPGTVTMVTIRRSCGHYSLHLIFMKDMFERGDQAVRTTTKLDLSCVFT